MSSTACPRWACRTPPQSWLPDIGGLGATPKDATDNAPTPGDGRRPLKAKTVNNHLAVLSKMLDTAVEWGLLDRLPRIKRLGVPPVEFDWLTRVESARFLESVEAHYPQWRALFYVALHTGMRRGEIFALRWRDLDIEGRRVAVRHNVWRGVLGTPKSGKHRVVPMTLTLARALVHHRSARCAGGELVFPGKGGRLTKHQDHVDRPLRGALGRAGLRCLRFHDLRHSFASQLVSAGRPLEQLRVLLGHASIITTQKYAHLAPARLWDAIDVLDQPI